MTDIPCQSVTIHQVPFMYLLHMCMICPDPINAILMLCTNAFPIRSSYHFSQAVQ